MNYEEKYKEALEVMRQWIAPCHTKEQLDTLKKSVFHELRESEDERIRKQLIDAIKIGRSNSGISFTEEAASRYIAWLEKHREEEIRKIRKEEYTNGFNDAAGFGKQKERGPLTKEEEYELHRIIEFLEDETCPSKWISLLHDISCLPYQKYDEQKEQKQVDLSDMMVHKEPYIAPVPTPMVADEQKPAEWSDTKELVFKDICNHLEEEGYSGWVLLLNALRNGEFQPKLAWSKEDKKIIDTIVSVLGQYIDYKAVSGTGSGYATPRYSKEIDWLNSLSLNLKKKNENVAKLCSNEWSEEDEDFINMLILHFNYLINKGGDSVETYKSYIKKLKSLRPSWKPSEEQMKALQNAVALTACDKELARLYNQLKKL